MKTISVERLKYLFSYHAETGLITRNVANARRSKIGESAGSLKPDGYMQLSIDGKNYQFHRIAWALFHGVYPASEIDHINGVKNDNKISNLRLATRQENMQNIFTPMSHSKTGIRGVSLKTSSGKYVAQIKVDGVKKSLGYFTTKEEASDAYLSAKKSLHKFSVYAALNKDSDNKKGGAA